MITSSQIKDNTIRTQDIRGGAVTPAKMSTAAKSGGFKAITTNINSVAADVPTTASLTCPTGKAYAGGGAFWYVDSNANNTPDAGEPVVGEAAGTENKAAINAIKWVNAGKVQFVATHNVAAAQGDLFAWAHCATA